VRFEQSLAVAAHPPRGRRPRRSLALWPPHHARNAHLE